jgi:hypothetical protein
MDKKERKKALAGGASNKQELKNATGAPQSKTSRVTHASLFANAT